MKNIINTDSYFEIGSAHEVCQDYALSGKINDRISYCIVADGCSSSRFTDIGARVLAHSASKFIRFSYQNIYKLQDLDLQEFDSSLRHCIIYSAYTSGIQLQLPLEFANATILISLTDGVNNRFFVYGDGAIAIKFIDGEVLFITIKYDNDAPFYLNYLMNAQTRKLYVDQFGDGEITISKIILSEGDKKEDSYKIKDFNYDMHNTIFEFSPIIETALISSDGIFSFLDEDRDFPNQGRKIAVSGEDMVEKFIDFKNYKGAFVRRRMGRIKRDNFKGGRSHFDDICTSAFHITETEE